MVSSCARAAMTCSTPAASAAVCRRTLSASASSARLLDLRLFEFQRVVNLLRLELLGEELLHSRAIVLRQIHLSHIDTAQHEPQCAPSFGLSSVNNCRWISARRCEKISRTVYRANKE